MVRQHLIRRLAMIGIIILLVVIPAGTMVFLTYRSLEEIKFREDIYYERIGYDIAKRIIDSLELPLFAPGASVLDESLNGASLGDEEEIINILAKLERSDNFSSSFVWYPGPGFEGEARKLYYNTDVAARTASTEEHKAIKELADRIFEESATFDELPRGFYPRTYGAATVAISRVGIKGQRYLMTLVIDGKNNVLGFLAFRINLKEYQKQARMLYSEQEFLSASGKYHTEAGSVLGVEIFFNLEPFNDSALEATRNIDGERYYVFRSQPSDSLFWGVRAFIADPEGSRINRKVVNSMFAMLGGMLALILLGILLLYHFVTKQVQLARLKSNFVSNVSHELKTPLSLIRLFAETLQLDRAKSEHEKQRFYKIINNESQRLAHLIENILDFSRIEEGEKKYEFASFSLKELLSQTLDAYKYQLESAGFELTVVMDDDLPPAFVDRDSFRQAVLNLIDNAVKYSLFEKRIKITLGRQGSFIRLEIEDAGIGISKDDLPHVFDMFFRVSRADVYEVKGSGLGLSVVKHIIDAHRGKIEVWSEPGKGSRFSLLFPVAVNERVEGRTEAD